MIIDQPTGVSHECLEEEKNKKSWLTWIFIPTRKKYISRRERERERERESDNHWRCWLYGRQWDTVAPGHLHSACEHHLTISPSHLTTATTTLWSAPHHQATRLYWLLRDVSQPPTTSVRHYDTLLGYINITPTTRQEEVTLPLINMEGSYQQWKNLNKICFEESRIGDFRDFYQFR